MKLRLGKNATWWKLAYFDFLANLTLLFSLKPPIHAQPIEPKLKPEHHGGPLPSQPMSLTSSHIQSTNSLMITLLCGIGIWNMLTLLLRHARVKVLQKYLKNTLA